MISPPRLARRVIVRLPFFPFFLSFFLLLPPSSSLEVWQAFNRGPAIGSAGARVLFAGVEIDVK